METALDTGQRLFHAGSYETVGLAALTDALGVKPPSFYKAFGSKSEFFAQVIERYAQSALALDDILLPGRAPADALAELLESAARTYARDPEQRGTLFSKPPEAMTEMTASFTHAGWQISAVIDFANLSPAPIQSAHRR
ncbi:TetR/AcrR family transcriptional regulator [Salinicola sp. MH3R3-1]|uniref:TetR/AcrR family transcriptional regulator n=1 Tax=Salinicola sp. MH3R3-1 TaxID=1928762 RepID=UPI001AF02248|nr:TetR/AcrR family transcriptional regulator [Salinicola sp. MH3R3-1]